MIIPRLVVVSHGFISEVSTWMQKLSGILAIYCLDPKKLEVGFIRI